MRSNGLSRRAFLARTSLGFAGVCLGVSGKTASAMMGGMGMRGGGNRFLDPPPGPEFRDPVEMPNLSSESGVVEVLLEPKLTEASLLGRGVNLLTYNGFFNGPTIRVRRGDRLRVHFKNSLPITNSRNMMGHERDLTNLHTHGLHVSPLGNSDNVMLQFRPGESFLYEYDLSKQEPGCLCLYHPHIHGTVAEQFWAGLTGALVVEDETDVLSPYETHLLILKDLDFVGANPTPHLNHMDYMWGKEGSLVFVNGQVNPVLRMKPGEVQRWRVVNASNARFYNLCLDQHPLYLIGTDDGLLDRPYPLSRILLSPSERVDLLVRAGAGPASYRFLSLPYNRGTCHGGHGGGLQQVTLMTVRCGGAPAHANLPTVINSRARRSALDLSRLPRQFIELSMGMGMCMGMGMGMNMGMGTGMGTNTEHGMNAGTEMEKGMDMGMNMGMGMDMGFINGRPFGPNATTITSRVGSHEVWVVTNRSSMDHPFHAHVNPAQVLWIAGGDPEYASLYSTIPAWKDTVIVPPMGSVGLLMPVMDYTGMAMLHCHIVEHGDVGMMANWNII